MAERYLTGAIQKEPGRLTKESVSFLQIGCGIPFELPLGRKRFSVVENLPFKIGTEKNGGLAVTVAVGKYHWAIAGEDTVENLPDELRTKVIIVRKLGFQPCQYRLGVYEYAIEKHLLAEGRDRIEGLEDIKPGTPIATKHTHLLERLIRQRGLNLAVVHDTTPETAPEFRNIFSVADVYRTGDTFREHHIEPRGEPLLECQVVLIKARRLPWGMARIFGEQLLPRVDWALANPERWLNPDPAPLALDLTPELEYPTNMDCPNRFSTGSFRTPSFLKGPKLPATATS